MLPKSFSERMSRLLGDEYAAFLASYERPRSVGLRMNPRKAALPPERKAALKAFFQETKKKERES